MILHDKLRNKKILLASGSPRRKELLASLNLEFEIVKQDIDETYPSDLKAGDIAEYLAIKKGENYSVDEDEILITADTIVWKDNGIMNKPKDRKEAVNMLKLLSGGAHEVYTGVCIKTSTARISLVDKTKVWFSEISNEEISFYVDHHSIYDKAGSYGIQDWIGYIAIEKIEGCYYNVMGFPVRRIYQALNKI